MKDNYIKMLVEESGDLVEKAVKFPELVSEIMKTMMRKETNVPCIEGDNQRINYSSPMDQAIRPMIMDYEGLGLDVDSLDENGFNISALRGGHFEYLTIKSA